MSGLLATQFVQKEKNKIDIRVVVDQSKFDNKQRSILINNAKAKLGNSIEFNIEELEELPRTKNGKARQAICSIEN